MPRHLTEHRTCRPPLVWRLEPSVMPNLQPSSVSIKSHRVRAVLLFSPPICVFWFHRSATQYRNFSLHSAACFHLTGALRNVVTARAIFSIKVTSDILSSALVCARSVRVGCAIWRCTKYASVVQHKQIRQQPWAGHAGSDASSPASLGSEKSDYLNLTAQIVRMIALVDVCINVCMHVQVASNQTIQCALGTTTLRF